MDNTVWLIIAGIVGILIGAALMYFLYVMRMQRQMHGYVRQVGDRTRQLEESGKRLTGLETELNNRQADLDDFRNRYQEADSRANEERVKVEGLNQTVERMQGQVHDYEERLRDAENQIASARNERAQHEKELETLRQRVEEERSRVHEMEMHLKAADKERTTLEARLRDAETKRRSVLDTVKRTLTGEEPVEEPVEMKK